MHKFMILKLNTFFLCSMMCNKLTPDVKEGHCEIANINSRLIIIKAFIHC